MKSAARARFDRNELGAAAPAARLIEDLACVAIERSNVTTIVTLRISWCPRTRGPPNVALANGLDGCLPYCPCSGLPRALLELREILSTTAVQRLQSLCPG